MQNNRPRLNWGGILWEGEGVKEIGRRKDNKEIVIRISPKYYRPSEVENLLGDASKAHLKLGWKPQIKLEELISEMIESDLNIESRDLITN